MGLLFLNRCAGCDNTMMGVTCGTKRKIYILLDKNALSVLTRFVCSYIY